MLGPNALLPTAFPEVDLRNRGTPAFLENRPRECRARRREDLIAARRFGVVAGGNGLDVQSRAEAAAALTVGVLAGIAGTAGMTAYQSLVARIRPGSSDDSSDGPPSRWNKAPAPAQVGRLALDKALHVQVPLERAPLLASAVHWGYGIAQGVGFAALRATAPRARSLPLGMAYGTAIWGASYVILPRLQIYEPITAYPPSSLAIDLSYHLVYGVGVASAFALASRLLIAGPGRVDG